ncbi:hypothetical protein [Peterkaempfera bronchialis]|uniref:Fibronectin type-III domain-containing protein n=1 Tax=Peterkaempfera bronchialis TaxID=2126346 RepID=A0A345SV89_9ACTN|nr:hypothetical protein [Peterkaempfera bronchialis]AXI77644.1 hypothetical protein C7M71_009505 [Peterkaempfera bronchialis]
MPLPVPVPVPVPPYFPGLAGYRELVAELHALGLRHAAELLRPPATPGAGAPTPPQGGLRVLDGLWFPGRGESRLLVDRAFLREAKDRWDASGDPRAPAVGGLLRRLGAALAADPQALHRVVLYQLCCLLRDSPGRPRAVDAEALGVHPEESGRLAAAVDGFPAAGPVRSAAECVVDAVAERRLNHAATLAGRLTAQSAADRALADLLVTVDQRVRQVGLLRRQAAEMRQRGRASEAARLLLRAVRQSVDDPAAMADLLASAAHCADEAQSADAVDLRTDVAPDGMRLRWTAVRGSRFGVGVGVGLGNTLQYRVLRFPDGRPEEAVEVATTTDRTSLLDPEVPPAVPLRYAVVPLRGHHLAGVPLATPLLVATPEVGRPVATAVPDGLALSWQPHPRAVAVRARRWAAGGPDSTSAPGAVVPCTADGLLDAELPPGSYRYLVASAYPGPSGEPVWSPGRTVEATAESWPSPVASLTVEPPDGEGRVRLRWTATARGQDRLVPWSRPPVTPGEDLSARLDGLPAALAEKPGPAAAQRQAELVPPPRTATRITAVTVLGRRAVAGPSVLIETPGTVTGLAVRRVDDGSHAEVRFDWPDPAVLVLVAWESDGTHYEHRVARSSYRAQGLRIPVDRGPSRVAVTPLPRPDAAAAVAGTAWAPLDPAPPPPTPAPPSPTPPGPTPPTPSPTRPRPPWPRRRTQRP